MGFETEAGQKCKSSLPERNKSTVDFRSTVLDISMQGYYRGSDRQAPYLAFAFL